MDNERSGTTSPVIAREPPVRAKQSGGDCLVWTASPTAIHRPLYSRPL
ncbi:MAG: hypothetical protein LBT00_10430 [Spirochaetaceae bacterium]|nr:hypothetical protein [Spirochaetaceae bacterium]